MALPNIDINASSPPLLWSNVHAAFEKINENFIALDLATGGTAVDLSNLFSDIKPSTTETYQLGDPTYRWKNIYTSEWSTVPGSELNGLWAGNAHIKGKGPYVDLPFNSTVSDQLIIDPNKTTWKTINVEGEGELIASSFTDTLNLINGDGVRITVNSGADGLTFDNTGVLKVNGTPNQIAVSGDGTGEITLTNLGVLKLTNSGSIGTRTPGTGIHVSSDTGNIIVTNTGVIQVVAGTGINIDSTQLAVSGLITISNAYPAPGNSFRYVISDGVTIEANNSSGVLNMNSGFGVSLTKNNVTDTITVNVNPVFDLTGSIFGDNSSKLVDAVESKIVGAVDTFSLRTSETKIALGIGAGQTNQGIGAIAIGPIAGNSLQGADSIAIGAESGSSSQGTTAIAIGRQSGNNNQGTDSISVGNVAGFSNQGTGAIAIGAGAGVNDQGAYAVAIGWGAGNNTQISNSIVLNASGFALDVAAAGLFIDPVRNQTGASGVVQYDATTKEVSYSSALGSVSGTFTGNIFTNLIDSADSSAITVTPIAIFSSDVIVQNDITAVRLFTSLIDSPDSSAITVTPKTIFSSDVDVENELRVRGSLMISATQLKALVAASTDFANFKARIAALPV